METKCLNDAVLMYVKPAIGKIDSKNELVMALTVDKQTFSTKIKRGLVRVITKRVGNENIAGYVDRSELWQAESQDGLSWHKTSVLKITGIEKQLDKLGKECGGKFLGLEDPDIYTDEKGIKHIYFTIAFMLDKKRGYRVYLGHANGLSLDSLNASAPVMKPLKGKNRGYKEVVISPITTNRYRINLTESNDKDYSVIASAKAKNFDSPWQPFGIPMHPKKDGKEWCAEHASPCAILSPNFTKHGDLLVGIMNGREKSETIKDKKIYKKFRPGLFLFNPTTGEIPWIASEPLFEDPDAVTITFASDFVELNNNEGLLYAHVNDSFVRVYKINKKGIADMLPK